MDTDAIIEKIAEFLDVSPDSLSLESTSENVEGWDSMVTMQILVMLSSDFQITLPPNETTQLQSVKGIVQLVEERGEAES